MATPKPTPTKLKILRGNPGKRPLNKREPQPRRGIPTCPDHLDKLAKTEWKRITPELNRLGLLTLVDRAALAAYCVCYSRWVQAEKFVKEQGLTSLGSTGQVIVNPYVRIASDSMAAMKTFITEFGLTPSSRTKLQVEPGSKQDEAAAKYLA